MNLFGSGLGRALALALASVCLALGAAACGASGESSAESADAGSLECRDGKLIVGIAKAKSGVATFFEEAGTNGTKIAIDDINAAGGIKGCQIETVEADTQSDPAVGAQAARTVLDKGAQILLVPDDFDLGIAAARVGQKAGVLTFSAAAGALLFGSDVGPTMVDGGITTRELGHAQGEFAADRGWKRAFQVIDPGLAYFTEQVDYFDEKFEPAGGEVVGSDEVDSLGGQSDYSATVSKVRRADPDVIMVGLVFPQVGTLIKQLRSAGVTTPIVGNVTLATRQLPKLVGKSGVKDVFYATQVYYEGSDRDPDMDPAIAQFTEKYEARFGKFPDQENAAAAYQSFSTIAEALQQEDVTDAASAAEAIFAQEDLEVPGGRLVRWDHGHAIWEPTIVGFDESGEFRQISGPNVR